MTDETLQHIELDAARRMEEQALDLARKLQARQSIKETLEEKVATGVVLMMSDEEERMLRSFRRFKDSCKPGAVFKWQTRPDPAVNVAITEDTALITDPQDVSNALPK